MYSSLSSWAALKKINNNLGCKLPGRLGAEIEKCTGFFNILAYIFSPYIVWLRREAIICVFYLMGILTYILRCKSKPFQQKGGALLKYQGNQGELVGCLTCLFQDYLTFEFILLICGVFAKLVLLLIIWTPGCSSLFRQVTEVLEGCGKHHHTWSPESDSHIIGPGFPFP